MALRWVPGGMEEEEELEELVLACRKVRWALKVDGVRYRGLNVGDVDEASRRAAGVDLGQGGETEDDRRCWALDRSRAVRMRVRQAAWKACAWT